MTGAYSYTTVSIDSHGTANVQVSMHPDEEMRVFCARGRDCARISVKYARADVTVSPTNATAPTSGDVQVARKLAESFAAYAAEVERLHAQNGGSSGEERVA